MGTYTDAFTRRAEKLAEGIKLLEQEAHEFVFLGRTYVAADIPILDRLYEYYLYRAAREAILGGAQEHSIQGRTFKRADLARIETWIKEHEAGIQALLGAGARSGPTFRFAVPQQ